MKLQDVIERALIDANFANDLKFQAMAAHRAGKGTKEWRALMKHFAKDAKQLAEFTKHERNDPLCTATTGLTLNVVSTAACTLTTTTTTTSYFCGDIYDKKG